VLALDHVILAVADLDVAAADLLGTHGLDSVFGGRHEGLGTANRIVPLGETYLELIGVDDPDAASTNPFGRGVLASTRDGDGLFAWAAATDDIAMRAKWIGSDVTAGLRVRPDGTELRWRMAGLAGSMADRSLPFFIQWDSLADEHPGRTPVAHRVDVKGITELEVAGQKTKVRNRVGGEDLPLRVVRGERPGPVSVTIATAEGEIVLR
jgi:hypothetical protein